MKTLAKELGLSSLWPLLDAFSRWRISGTGQRQDTEFIYNKQPDYFDEITNNGTVTHNANTGDLTLSLSDANDGSYAWMSSFPIPYTPGSGQVGEATGVLDLAGIGGGSAEFFLRSSISGSPVDLTVIPESQWLSDAGDGAIDWSKSHIFGFDFQSLKVGTVRFFRSTKGVMTPLAAIHNDNIRDSGYWRTPSLPAFWRIYNAGGETIAEVGYGDENNAIGVRYRMPANASATMKAICCTVKSEGGSNIFDMEGIPFTASTQQTARTVSGTLLPLVSIRSRAMFNSIANLILARPESFSVQTSEPIRVVPIINGQLTNASWVNVDTNESSLEYDVSATAISGGKSLRNFYQYATTTGPASGRFNNAQSGLLGKSFMWSRRGSPTGIFTIAAIKTGASDASCLASINGDELR